MSAAWYRTLPLRSPRHSSSRRYRVSSVKSEYDVIVVGGGHAGCEAAAAACRVGASTLLVTQKISTIGEMSCNPSFGGIGKGQLMREIDALDGLCCRICDLSGIQYKVLNQSKGPAVWGHRAQMDRSLYKKHMQQEILNTPKLQVKEEEVDDLLISTVTDGEEANAAVREKEEEPPVETESNSKNRDSHLVDRCSPRYRCDGIRTSSGQEIRCKAVVITTGTFLRGQINLGLDSYPAGRLGDAASTKLAETLYRLRLRLSRMKTGTPPRLDAGSIDFSRLSFTEGDHPPRPFSFLNHRVWMQDHQQIPTYLTFTNSKVADLVRKNIHKTVHIKEEVNGPRYCPSIESKVLRFGERSHQVWLEPEGLDSNVIYPNGISITLPPEIQEAVVHSIEGCKRAKMLRPGYGVEYDFVDPRQLTQSLQVKTVPGLFLAGQINGTTGYEEAAAQGVVAGANAALAACHREGLIIRRQEGYIGVLIDDLTTLGVSEPYRMFTSRAEFRLSLRPDNADTRLTPLGHSIGLVSRGRHEVFRCHQESLEAMEKLLASYSLKCTEWQSRLQSVIAADETQVSSLKLHHLESEKNQHASKTAHDVLAYVRMKHLITLVPGLADLVTSAGDAADRLCECIEIRALYSPLCSQDAAHIEMLQKEQCLLLDPDLDYLDPKLSLSNEARDALTTAKPHSIAAASRIAGVDAAAIRMLYYKAISDRERKRKRVTDT